MEIEFADIVGTEASKRTVTPAPTYAGDCVASAGPVPVNSGRRSWAASDGVFWGIGESHSSVPPGLYSCDAHPSIGPVLKRMVNNVDELIDLPDCESERLLQEIVQFRELKEKFQKFGFLYKRGILLWGPPGSGKTVTIQQLLRLFVTEGQGIALMVGTPDLASACMNMVRQIEPERQILAILEDFDALVDNHGESGYLNLLDGESQLQNVVYVATTNYPERLDKRFVDRPSRFDTIRYIGMPTAAARKAYLKHKIPHIAEPEIWRYVDATKDFSIAYLRELVVLTQCFGMPFDEAIERMKKMRQAQPKSGNADRSTFGFGG